MNTGTGPRERDSFSLMLVIYEIYLTLLLCYCSEARSFYKGLHYIEVTFNNHVHLGLEDLSIVKNYPPFRQR